MNVTNNHSELDDFEELSDENEFFDMGDQSALDKEKDLSKKVSKSRLCNLQLNTNKAGMEGLDTEKINEIIQKASKGSKFYLHKQRCQDKINERIAQMKVTLSKFSSGEIKRAEKQMDKLCAEMEKTRDLSKTIVHVDMDMFYAAVEMRDDPTLKNKPMAVGSNSMLSTSNYAARKFGVRAAMPGFIGKKLCPELVIVSCNFDKYREVSGQIQKIFEEYDPQFSPMSLDEAYLDITDYMLLNDDKYSQRKSDTSVAEAVVEEMRRKIHEKTDLTASAGIAANTRLAKVCSDLNKPNGQFYLPAEEKAIQEFVKDLSIRKITGIGNVSEQQLSALGIKTCSDLWTHRGILRLLFSETSNEYFMRISLGLGSTEFTPHTDGDRKSISNETTFASTSDRKKLFELCEELCRELNKDMVRKNIYGKVVTVKMKTAEFQVRTRAQTLLEYTQDEAVMISVSQKILGNEFDNELFKTSKPLNLRLLGVRMSNFGGKDQLSSKKQITITDLFKKSNQSKLDKEFVTQDTPNIPFQSNNNYSKACGSSKISHCSKAIPHSNSSVSSYSNDESRLKFSTISTEEISISDDNLSEINTSTSDTVIEEVLICPVCSKSKFTDINVLNSHLDTCLNASVVQELVKESKLSIDNRLSDNKHCKASNSKSLSQNKRKNTPSSKSSSKKQKRDVSRNTLHNYLVAD